MYLQHPKEIAEQLENISKDVVRSGIMPIVTKNGILVGSYLVQPNDGRFLVKSGSKVLYTTYTKSASMILARLLLKKATRDKINEIIEADRVAFSSRNDLEIYKSHYESAEKRNDSIKMGILMSRFEVADERYQVAKKTLQKSYSLLF
jgi:hypothetical protein